MIEELKKKYLTSFEDKILRIKKALESTDTQVLSTLIHQLAGSSGSYGFPELSDQCIRIEQMILENKDFKVEITPATECLLSAMKQVSQTGN